MKNIVMLAVTGLGLWTIAAPAQAGTIAQFGESVQIFNSPSSGIPGGGNVLAVYANVAGNYSATPGITVTSNDPNKVLNFSPNPSLQLGGLLSGTLDLTSESGVANVSGNLATGATHVYSSTSPGSSTITESSTITKIGAMDGLTFAVAGGGSANVTLTYLYDGSLGSVGGAPSYSSEIKYFIGTADMDWTGSSTSGVGQVGTAQTSGFNTFNYTSNTPSGFQFQGTFTVTNGQSVALFYSQEMNCGAGQVCDFSNTGQMGLILPSGVSFTSDSGVFLTQTEGTAPVPEPASFLLTGVGIAICCVGRRRWMR